MKTFKKHLIFLLSILLITGTAVKANPVLSDKEISEAVDMELLHNATTPSYLIDVTSTEGIVTLRGSVDNILAKDRSVQIAQTVKGVRGVVDQIEVNAPDIPDATLRQDIVNALIYDPATDSYELTVEVADGHITLSGTVESWQEKQLSSFVTKGVRGVKSVKNNISINFDNDRGDREIKHDIDQSLKNDIRIDDALVTVIVKNGKVSLSGLVGSAAEKSTAEAHSWSAGVVSVDSKDLDVVEWARNDDFKTNKYVKRTDSEIKDALDDAFRYDPRVFSFNPDIHVQYGVVTLTGVVDNLKAKRAAERDAKNVVGVIRVKNYLKVRPAEIPYDSDLENQLANKFINDPIVEKWQIDVTADNGVIYLNGTVDSYFEKVQATDIASKTKGVVAIENNLVVNDNNDKYFYNYYGWNSYYPPYQIDIDYINKSDDEIVEDIENQIWWSPYVNINQVEVTVDNRIATLEGVVDTKREKLMAEINALEGGAIAVKNNLSITYIP